MKKIFAVIALTIPLLLSSCVKAPAPTLDDVAEYNQVETVMPGVEIFHKPYTKHFYVCATQGPLPGYAWITESGCSEAMDHSEILPKFEESLRVAFDEAGIPFDQ